MWVGLKRVGKSPSGCGGDGCEFTVWSEMRFPRMRYSCWMLWQWKEDGMVGEGGGPGPLGLLQWLLPWPMAELTQPATDMAMGSMRLRTDTFDSPPPSMGTHPPEESSLVITCARTRTNELFLQHKQNKTKKTAVLIFPFDRAQREGGRRKRLVPIHMWSNWKTRIRLFCSTRFGFFKFPSSGI